MKTGGAIKLKLPMPLKYGYSTSITRQYNKHPLNDGYYNCVPVNNNEVGIRLDNFKTNLDQEDSYYITVVGSPLI